jgi:hypothetical protein
MASKDLAQAQPPDTYGACTNIEWIIEPEFLEEFCPILDQPLGFSLELKGHESRRVESLSSSLSSYSAVDFSHGYHNPLVIEESNQSLDAKTQSQATSAWSWEIAPEEGTQRVCSVCFQLFSSLGALDKHARNTSHKAWRCQEIGCGKSYARRDTFLRHALKHSQTGFACLECSKDGTKKVFKRKDHLNEHIRKRHSKGEDSARSA